MSVFVFIFRFILFICIGINLSISIGIRVSTSTSVRIGINVSITFTIHPFLDFPFFFGLACVQVPVLRIFSTSWRFGRKVVGFNIWDLIRAHRVELRTSMPSDGGSLYVSRKSGPFGRTYESLNKKGKAPDTLKNAYVILSRAENRTKRNSASRPIFSR